MPSPRKPGTDRVTNIGDLPTGKGRNQIKETETFPRGRRCLKCPTYLSIYNPADICHPCGGGREPEVEEGDYVALMAA